ncbi:MAG: DUF4192 family protein [Actinophytocola sp.]|uniref:DUF4192 domain-containing protein n=1 Tax=Actinophytocola sp. TaxID=1872138 RepID=UPI003C762421
MTTSLPHTHIALRDLSALTAGIPYMIGFPPKDSLVLFTFTRGPALTMATTMRADLPAPGHVDAVADHLVAAAAMNEAAAVLAVLIGGTQEEHRPLVDALSERLAAKDILLVHASWVRTITHGERWRCYLDPQCTAEIPDPQTSTWAVASAIAGDPMYRDREDMATQLAPDPPKTLARREELLDTHLRSPQSQYTEADLVADVAMVTSMLTEAEATPDLPVLNDRQVVRLARALSHPEVKDECIAAALTATPHAAERLWTVLIRALPAPERAEPAVLLAMSAYLRGAGVLAALAVRTALDANPAHAMALLLDQALSHPVPAHHLRTLLMKSILRNEGLADDTLDDDPPWETTPSPQQPTSPKEDPPRPDNPPDTEPPRTDRPPSNAERASMNEPSNNDGPPSNAERASMNEPSSSDGSPSADGRPANDRRPGNGGPLRAGGPPRADETSGVVGPPGNAEPPDPPSSEAAAFPGSGSLLPEHAPGALNVRTAATLGLLAPARPTVNPLTECLPPWPGGDGE